MSQDTNTRNEYATYAIYRRVWLDTHTQQYENILTIDRYPEDLELQGMVRLIHIPTISPFKPVGRFACGDPCGGGTNGRSSYAFVSVTHRCGGSWMNVDELPKLLSRLGELGYVVDADTSRLLNEGGWVSTVETEKLVCYIRGRPNRVQRDEWCVGAYSRETAPPVHHVDVSTLDYGEEVETVTTHTVTTRTITKKK
jgi:hypothetical protein